MCCSTGPLSEGGKVVPFVNAEAAWSGDILRRPGPLVTAVGAGTTYPDYKPAPFIVSSKVDGVDMVTVVTEGIYSYCGVKLKIDTDRHLGAECAIVRAEGEPVGHVTTGEYGSQMLSLGGVNHLTHGGKKEGRVTCDTLLNLCNGKGVELVVDGGASVIVQAGKAPIINGKHEERMRVGCGSATIGMFAKQWGDKVDEVVVVDDHITGVLSEHQAGKLLGHARHRHQDERAPLDARPLFPCRRARNRLGRNECLRSARHRRGLQSEGGAARPDDADGLDDRRAARLLSARRGSAPDRGGAAGSPCANRSSASARTASRRSARCSSWRAPEVRCGPA